MIIATTIIIIFIFIGLISVAGAILYINDFDIKECSDNVKEYFKENFTQPSGEVISVKNLHEIKSTYDKELIKKTNYFIQNQLNPAIEKAVKDNEPYFEFRYNKCEKAINIYKVNLDYLIEKIKEAGYIVTIEDTPYGYEEYTIIRIRWGIAASE